MANEFMTGIPLIGGLFDDSEEKALAELAKKRALYEQLQTPTFEQYRPEEERVVGTLTPEEMQYQTLQEDPRLLQQQRDYLSKLQGMSEEGLGAEDRLGFATASKNAAADAQARRGAALQSARARGIAGGGMEAALSEIGSQQAADRQSMEGMQQAAEAAKRRALYTQAYGGELSGQRRANLDTESQNKDIINRFNQMNAQARNQAQLYNLGQRQDVANRNVGNRNQAFQYNQGQQQQDYQNRLGKADKVAGGYGEMADFYGAQGEKRRRQRGAIGSAIGGGIGAMAGGPAGYSIGSGIGGGLGGM